MSLTWQLILAYGIVLVLAGLLMLLLWRPLINIFVDTFTKRLLTDPYPENIAEMLNVFKKVGVQNVLEADLRGNGGPLDRPFGSPLHLSPWDKLMLNPVYLSREPLLESAKVSTETVIGPKANRPLIISMPIMISGMSYGFGLSLQAKLALAKGADKVNTASNTGVGPFLPEERKATRRLIIQYHRGSWGKEEGILRQADAIEIQLGYGALASAPITVSANHISDDLREYLRLAPGEELIMTTQLEGARDRKGLKRIVEYLRELTNGVPIGVKIGATHFLERELDIITSAGIDFITIDGAEAGINYGPAILADDTGLPTLPALCRAAAYLRQHGLKKRISLIVSGGLYTPGQFLKALALGADVVNIGTIAVVVMAHLQLTQVIPWEPPTELVYEQGKFKNCLDPDEGAENIARFLTSCHEEMILAMRAMGRCSYADLSVKDLSALSPEVAQMTGAELALFPPGYREEIHV
ncbi:MAG TPA: FMN-binding glutamate synthase family protein [Bacillota bacterium]|nr:FMN-binding glutamate synthase family protein [Bacillota bacterium]HPT86550.1 FMN-binding glutamate synthase family protein [Bacillota bacterium]